MLAGQAEPGSLGRPFELALDALGLDAVPEATDRLAAVVQAYLDRVGEGPALVMFEDLHWADAESLGVFERLAAGSPAGTLLVGLVPLGRAEPDVAGCRTCWCASIVAGRCITSGSTG